MSPLMKRITNVCILILISLSSRAGFVIGYQGGTFLPAIANTQATMYYYNKVYHANFHYNNFFSGIFVGVRGDAKHGWFSMAWDKKQNVSTSDYINANNEIYKLSIRVRMTELVFDGGYRSKGWGIGCGLNLTNFDVLTKRGKFAEFDAAKWGHEYGTPIKLLGLPNYPGFSLIAERDLSKWIILRMTYHFGIGSIDLANDYSLTFYSFKPRNIGLALLLNIWKHK